MGDCSGRHFLQPEKADEKKPMREKSEEDTSCLSLRNIERFVMAFL